MGNTAIYDNVPYQVDSHITTRGSDWLYAVTAIMGASSIGFLAWMSRRPFEGRIFYYITSAITMTACVAYYTMASNLGYSPVQVEYQRGGKVSGNTRQIFYARYIDWVVTTPLLLLDLLLTCGASNQTILFTIFLDIGMIVLGLFAALTSSIYKWGYFTLSCIFYFGILYNVLIVGKRSASAIGADVGRAYTIVSIYLIGIWFLYPIAFGLSEGGNVISSDGESVFYGVLDVLAKPVFGFVLLWLHRNIDLNRLGLGQKTRYSVGSGTTTTA